MQIAMDFFFFAGVSWVFAVKNSGKSFMQRGPGQQFMKKEYTFTE